MDDVADWGRVHDLVEVRWHAGGRAMRPRGRCCSAGREVGVWVERSRIEEPVGASSTARRRMFQVR
jgi:hypothetical protein